eukprot:CFRG8316T1
MLDHHIIAVKDHRQTEYIRKSIKYVIANEDVPMFVNDITSTLPISPFQLPSGETVNSQVNSSSYFDGNSLPNYKQRVTKEEGSELYRIRWYDNDLSNVDTVFIERKTHHCASLVGKHSTKVRFTVRKEESLPFLAGLPLKEQTVSKSKLAKEIQHKMTSLVPKVRTQYLRTSFMNPDLDDGIRVTLDQQINVSRDRPSWETILSSGDTLPRFEMPFSVVEVKVRIAEGSKAECPEYIAAILDKCRAVQLKISKYNYACKLLYPEHANPSPTWWEELLSFTRAITIYTSPSRESKSWTQCGGEKEYSRDFSVVSCEELLGYPTLPKEKLLNRGWNTYSPFECAWAQGFDRRTYGKVDSKAFMANERTFFKFLHWTTTLATFCIGLLQVSDSQGIIPVSSGILLFCDACSIYAILIFNLRRVYLVACVKSKGSEVPGFLNEWRVFTALITVYFLAMNAYVIYLWINPPTRFIEG